MYYFEILLEFSYKDKFTIPLFRHLFTLNEWLAIIVQVKAGHIEGP